MLKIRILSISEELDEGRVEDIKKRYAQDPEKSALVDRFATAPGNNKYLDWMMKHHEETSPENMMSAIQKFDKYSSQTDSDIEQKDINSYENYESLKIVLDDLVPPKKELEREGTEKVYENDNIVIFRPTNQEASCKLGQNTRWCIAATKTQNYFNYYGSAGVRHYFVINKKLPKENVNHKIAFSLIPERTDFEIHNSKDDSLNERQASEIYGQELYNKILSVIKTNLSASKPSTIREKSPFENLKSRLTDEEVTYSEVTTYVKKCFFKQGKIIDDPLNVKHIIKKLLNLNNPKVNTILTNTVLTSYHSGPQEFETIVKKYIDPEIKKKLINEKIVHKVSEIKTSLKKLDETDYDQLDTFKRELYDYFAYDFQNSEDAKKEFLNKLVELNDNKLNKIIYDTYIEGNPHFYLPEINFEIIKKLSRALSANYTNDDFKDMLKILSKTKFSDKMLYFNDYKIKKMFDSIYFPTFFDEDIKKSDLIIEAISHHKENLGALMNKLFYENKILLKFSNTKFLVHILDKIESLGYEGAYYELFGKSFTDQHFLIEFTKKLFAPFYEKYKDDSDFNKILSIYGEHIIKYANYKPKFLEALKSATGDNYSKIVKLFHLDNVSESKLFLFNKDNKVFKLLR